MLKSLIDFAMKEVEANGGGATPLTVEAIDNHVYFYAGVDSDRCLALMLAIREVDAMLRSEQISRGLERDDPTPIWLHINSPGGDTLDGLAAADQIAAIRTPVYSVIEGVAASAATLISMACTRRFILPNAFMLVHQLSGFAWGSTHEEFKDEMKVQEMTMDKMAAFYAAYSKKTEDEIREMLKRDFWMDASACVEYGFADEVLGSV
jgi:ATP-dependent Clp endopeptidase proteolytic subunit ClpP